MSENKCPRCGVPMFSATIRGHGSYNCQGKHVVGGAICIVKGLHRQLEQEREKNAELQAVVDDLQTTADGVPLYIGMQVYSPDYTGGPYAILEIDQRCVRITTPTRSLVDFDRIYSTLAAAEAAKEKT